MLDDERTTGALRAHLDALAPTDDARIRITASAQMSRSDQVRRTGVGRGRMPRPRLALGAVLAGTAIVASVVALAPSLGTGHKHLHHGIGPDTAAARELERAGDSAATEPWGPLAPGQYYHLYSATVPGAEDVNVLTGGPISREIWLNSVGDGQLIEVAGAIDPDRYPSVTATGKPNGISTAPAHHFVPFHDMLAKPNGVDVIRWVNRGSHLTQRQYVRTRQGLHLYSRGDSGLVTTDPHKNMLQFWGVTMTQIRALSDHGGAEMDDAVQRLLVTQTLRPTLATGAFGLSQELLEREQRLENAVRLLGAAPLPPAARQSLYSWIATQPGARIDEHAHDALGRRGVRITYDFSYDKHLPASTITVRQLLRRAIAVGASVEPDAAVHEYVHHDHLRVMSPDHVLHLFARHDRRTWRLSFIFDPASSELLQQQLQEDQQSDAGVPELDKVSGTVILTKGAGPNGDHSISSSSEVYAARGRATLDHPVTLVCATNPEICHM